MAILAGIIVWIGLKTENNNLNKGKVIFDEYYNEFVNL